MEVYCSCVGSFSPLTFDSPHFASILPYDDWSRFLHWGRSPFDPGPSNGRLCWDFCNDYAYMGLRWAHKLYFRWNGSLSVWLSIGPVIMLDKEVSPIPLSRISDARYITIYTRSIISGQVSCCHFFQWALILSDRMEEKTLEMWAISFFSEKWVAQLLLQTMYLIVRYNAPRESDGLNLPSSYDTRA